MAAAAQFSTFTLQGSDGTVYNVDTYASDVANARCNFDGGNGASSSSLTYWVCPQQCTVLDFSIKTGMTDTTQIVLLANSAQIPNVKLRYANFLNTLTTRPPIRVTLKAGTQFSAIQLA